MDTSKIARYVWKGRHDLKWYLQAENLFVDLFGRERLQLVTRLFAATAKHITRGSSALISVTCLPRSRAS